MSYLDPTPEAVQLAGHIANIFHVSPSAIHIPPRRVCDKCKIVDGAKDERSPSGEAWVMPWYGQYAHLCSVCQRTEPDPPLDDEYL